MDNLNLEKLIEYLKKNYLVLSLGVLLVVSLSTYYFLYSANQKNKTYMSQELYTSYLNELSTFDGTEIEILESKLNELKNNNSSSIYYYLANFYQVKIYFENNEELKALDLMQKLNLDLESENSQKHFLRDLSRIRLASIFIDFERFEEAREVLDRSFSSYEALKFEKLGDLEKSTSNSKKAQNYYEMAIEASTNQTQINLINFKLSSLANSNEN
ncbi:MAG: tetratricopeptide repeat protein [Pseudomonadota bacterium]|nr:tetratricopeptide repeat protein [Pseudomonadota bacterium]MEC9193432.1 tetratricopeptide repeat protein [Pseudomonadota bacterium]|tara:strand:+ start:332 stop:976 length:645 start_codon:yes stop_codon:yes gene_type:complete